MGTSLAKQKWIVLPSCCLHQNLLTHKDSDLPVQRNHFLWNNYLQWNHYSQLAINNSGYEHDTNYTMSYETSWELDKWVFNRNPENVHLKKGEPSGAIEILLIKNLQHEKQLTCNYLQPAY